MRFVIGRSWLLATNDHSPFDYLLQVILKALVPHTKGARKLMLLTADPNMDDLLRSCIAKRYELYNSPPSLGRSTECTDARRLRIRTKIAIEYKDMQVIAEAAAKHDQELKSLRAAVDKEDPSTTSISVLTKKLESKERESSNSTALALTSKKRKNDQLVRLGAPNLADKKTTAVKHQRKAAEPVKPKWHAPWKLMRVLAGHTGWVRCVAVDPSNKFFFTGSNDRTIRCVDLATGALKLTLTAHSHAVRGLAVSSRYPYLFSVGDDKTVKCWDLETNKVIRSYHGHLQSVHCVGLHPKLDLLVTGGRDAAARVWDIRSRTEVHVLAGHEDSVEDLIVQGVDPQIITGSMDKTVKLWDLVAGKCLTTLTNHKKGVRSLVKNPREHSFVSGSADCLKKWEAADGRLMLNMYNPENALKANTIVNTLACNQRDVLFSGGLDGSLRFWDYQSGHCFCDLRTVPQPGSLDSEACVMASAFDMTGSRLITCEADKSVKIWKEDPDATELSHPIQWDREKAVEDMMNERF